MQFRFHVIGNFYFSREYRRYDNLLRECLDPALSIAVQAERNGDFDS